MMAVQKLWRAFLYVFVMLAAGLPLIWTFYLSLCDNSALLHGHLFGGELTASNYIQAISNPGVLIWFLNSLVVALLTTMGVLTLSSAAGYAFGRLRFPGRDMLYALTAAGLAIPEQAVIIVRHQMFSWLHWHNSWWGLALPGMSAPLGVILMTEAFRSLSRSHEEAAQLDRANGWAVFWHVLLPQTRTMLASLGIYTFLGAWNDYWWPLISATRPEKYTLAVGLAAAQMNFAQTSGVGFLMAQAILAAFPMLLIFIAFQKYIFESVGRGFKL